MNDASPGDIDEVGQGRGGKRVTMTDVARHAGCSQSTVSVVLNGTIGVKISRTTRKRVREAVAALGYRHQKSLQRRGTGLGQIAVIFDQADAGPEPVGYIDGVREAAWESGYVVAAYQTGSDAEMEPQTIDAVLRNRVDAIIYATVTTREVNVPEALYYAGVPVILLNCFSPDRHFPSVVPGEASGGYHATGALLDAGHRRIAHITGEMWMDAARDRLQGYRDALVDAGIAYDPALIREGDWLPGSGYEQTRALMALDDAPTAIFCSSDGMAVGCYAALNEQGLHIPRDLSVIGYDGDETPRYLTPQLTTVLLPHREMGRWAAEQALAPGPGTGEKCAPVKFECALVERASIRPPRLPALQAHQHAAAPMNR